MAKSAGGAGRPELDLAADSPTNIKYYHRVDATNWLSLLPALQQGPVPLIGLWLSFPSNGTPAVPKIRGIRLL